MLKRLTRQWILNKQRTQFDRYLEFIKALTPRERSGTLVVAWLAREMLTDSQAFEEQLLNGEVLLTDEARTRLRVWMYAVSKTKRKMAADKTSPQAFVAGGLTVWEFSELAVVYPELLARGRELWRELLLSLPFVDSFTEDVLPSIAGTWRFGLFYVPRYLVPEEVELPRF